MSNLNTYIALAGLGLLGAGTWMKYGPAIAMIALGGILLVIALASAWSSNR